MSRRLSHQLRNYRSLITFKNLNGLVEQLRSDLQQHMRYPSIKKLEGWISNFQSGIRMMGCFVGRECSPIFAQRVFRSYRVLQLHSKLWSNHIGGSGRPVSNRALLGFLIFSVCQPGNKIPESIHHSELVEHMKDLEFIHELTAATVVCPNCRDRLVVDKKVPNVKYCHCPDTKTAYDRKIDGYAWTPFVETADLLIWRMPHPSIPGLFIYKVYGYYDDLSPEDFLDTQLDIQYRKKWDDTVLKLEIIESNTENSQDVIYWEMKWPTMFSNRDYLFARRHLVDSERQAMVIMSKAIEHSSVPERKGIHRVQEYWSVMQVNSVKGLNQPGVEFGLTYFDNPGLSLPGWLNNWAAMTAIPDFLDKQRNAARAKKKAVSQKVNEISSLSDQKGQSTTEETLHQDSNNNSKHNTPGESSTSTSSVTVVDINAASSSTGGNTPPTEKTEILSQFFKERVLQIPQ